MKLKDARYHDNPHFHIKPCAVRNQELPDRQTDLRILKVQKQKKDVFI